VTDRVAHVRTDAEGEVLGRYDYDGPYAGDLAGGWCLVRFDDTLEEIHVPASELRHVHDWGPLERSRLAGTLHRKCQGSGCNYVNALDDDQED
jgi:hypothetical protein